MDKYYKQILERSEEKENGCIEWNGALNDAGYGVKRIEEKFWYVHRWSYTVNHWEIPKEMTVDHMCHNSKCHNPDHLRLLTHKENAREWNLYALKNRGYSFPTHDCDYCWKTFNITESKIRRKEKLWYKTMCCSSSCSWKLNYKPIPRTQSPGWNNVFQYSLEGDFIGKYDSNMDAERKTWVNNSSISNVCNEKRKTAWWFKWSYLEI